MFEGSYNFTISLGVLCSPYGEFIFVFTFVFLKNRAICNIKIILNILILIKFLLCELLLRIIYYKII